MRVWYIWWYTLALQVGYCIAFGWCIWCQFLVIAMVHGVVCLPYRVVHNESSQDGLYIASFGYADNKSVWIGFASYLTLCLW